MASARFLHAADLHLGAPLQSLGGLLSPAAHDRIVSLSRTSFDRLVEVALQQQVEFVVFAGDVFDSSERDPSAQRRVILGLRKLTEAGIRVFIAHGNHDPLLAQWKGRSELPSGVEVFPVGEVASHRVGLSNGVEVQVAGVSYGATAESNNLVPLFSGLSGGPVVGVLHTNVGGIGAHGNYAPCSEADLVAAPVNYWALGHIHDRQVHATPKGFWAYPGNLQGRSTKATECGPKGVLVVDIDGGGGLAEPQFHECDVVRFLRLDVDMSSAEDDQQARDLVMRAVEHQADAQPNHALLLRVELVGASSAAATILKGFDSLRNDVVLEASRLLGDGAVIKMRNSCRPAIDVVAERKRETLLGSVLNRMDSDSREQLTPEVRTRVEALLVERLAVGS